MNKNILVLIISVLVFSCGTKKTVITKKPKTKTVRVTKKGENKEASTPKVPAKIYASATEQYIDTYKEIAQEEMRLYNIPASITIAQGILESGSGKGRLSIEANNHFGIKCHNWSGAKIYHDDDEAQECFRKYNNAKYSFRDHSLFLTGRKRYEGLFKLKQTNYKGWAKGLRAAGYATDKRYPEKLISLIERYRLYELDGGKKLKTDIDIVKSSRVIPKKITHIVVKGDTLYYISKMHNLTVEELKEINNLKNNNISIGQELQVNKN
ncbi:glucosaminidase domain-containing protein [Postechiella marina]|uniref:Peptidoglycan hydrolase n=1 Tax=Postechiella marina TaxID=943941 RepID=A0ABP8CAE3_9FLAO